MNRLPRMLIAEDDPLFGKRQVEIFSTPPEQYRKHHGLIHSKWMGKNWGRGGKISSVSRKNFRPLRSFRIRFGHAGESRRQRRR